MKSSDQIVVRGSDQVDGLAHVRYHPKGPSVQIIHGSTGIGKVTVIGQFGLTMCFGNDGMCHGKCIVPNPRTREREASRWNRHRPSQLGLIQGARCTLSESFRVDNGIRRALYARP